MKAIGIDIGTTTISAVVMGTKTKNVIESRIVFNRSFIEVNNDWERIQDVVVICEKTEAVVSELIKKHLDTDYFRLTGQMHGILYLDEEGKYKCMRR